MRKNFGPQSWLLPMPVLIIGTYDADGLPDAMNAAWGGIHDTNQIAVCIDPGHKSAENLQLHQCFTVSFGNAAHVTECDYLGIVSAHDEPEKLKKAGLHTRRAENINAPVIEEFPMTLECRLLSYAPDTGCAVAEIINVSADEEIIAENGTISAAKLDPICYDPVDHTYWNLGKIVGKAFSDGKKLS